MKTLVCFKAVPDLELLTEEDWAAATNLRVNTGFVKNIINCFDESALEMALKLSDYSEGFSALNELTALTIGEKKSEPFLKNLYALKFGKAVRIESDEDIEFLPEVTAAVISRYAANNNQELIIMGRQSNTGDNSKTPLLVAELLGWPCITQVTNIAPDKNCCLQVTNMVDGGTLTQVVKTPCVLAVGNAPCSYMRVPTLKDKMQYGKRAVEVLDIKDFTQPFDAAGTDFSCELKNISVIDNKRKGIVINGESPAEKAGILYHSYLKERLERL